MIELRAGLSAHRVPLVVLDASGAGVDPGVPVSLDCEGRRVAGGVWPGRAQVSWADALAPLGVPVTYTLRVGDEQAAATVTRTAPGADVLCALDGRDPVVTARQDSDEASWAVRAYTHDVPDRYYPTWEASTSAGAPSGTVVVRTAGADTAALEALVRAQRPVLLLHNTQHATHGTGCEVQAVRAVVITRATSLALPTTPPAREWTLSTQEVAPPTTAAPLATWGEAGALGWRWGSGLSWAQVARAVAAGLGPGEAVVRNVFANPSFETGTHQVAWSACTVARDEVAPFAGAHCLRVSVSSTVASIPWIVQVLPGPVEVGACYAAAIRARHPAGEPRFCRLQWQFRIADATTWTSSTRGGWVQMGPADDLTAGAACIELASDPAPAGATQARLQVQFATDAAGALPPAGVVAHTDAWHAATGDTPEQALADVASYLDGDTPGARWAGEPHASVSSGPRGGWW